SARICCRRARYRRVRRCRVGGGFAQSSGDGARHHPDRSVMPASAQPLTPHLIRRTLTYRWVCLGLLFLSGLLAFFTRLAPAVAIPDLRDAFVLNATDLGLLASSSLSPFGLMQPLAGAPAGALGPRR